MRKLIFSSEVEEKEYYEKRRLKRIERAAIWNKLNKEKYRHIQKKYSDKNREDLNLRAVKYREENRETYLIKRRLNSQRKKLEDPLFKFSNNIRSMINMSFKRRNSIKASKTEEILGCSLSFFINYILSKCKEGITLEDFNRYGYHIDHIIPLSTANNEEEVIKLCHYINLQPLWWKENIKKSNKI